MPFRGTFGQILHSFRLPSRNLDLPPTEKSNWPKFFLPDNDKGLIIGFEHFGFGHSKPELWLVQKTSAYMKNLDVYLPL